MNGVITAVEGQATSYVLQSSFPYAYQDYINKTHSGHSAIRVLSYNRLPPNVTTKLELSGVHYVFNLASGPGRVTPVAEFTPGNYDVKVNGQYVGSIFMQLGGVYTLQTYMNKDTVKIGLTTVTSPNSVHILWLLPQYIALTTAEVVFDVTAFQFAFTQAPSTMKSLLQAGFMLTIAGGNLIVVIVTNAGMFKRQVRDFSLLNGCGNRKSSS